MVSSLLQPGYPWRYQSHPSISLRFMGGHVGIVPESTRCIATAVPSIDGQDKVDGDTFIPSQAGFLVGAGAGYEYFQRMCVLKWSSDRQGPCLGLV